jgi:error-prone DNA polymerase
MSETYAELHAWSNFSFLQGGSHPEELIEGAATQGVSAIALTDRDGLYGAVRFASYARKREVDAIVGSELTFENGTHIVLLVENALGYANLCRLISAAQMRGSKGDARLRIEDLHDRSDGLIALSGGPCGRVETVLARDGIRAAVREAQSLATIFDERFYLELQQHLTPQETQRNLQLVRIARRTGLPYVATNGVVYAHADDALTADVLACVRDRTTMDAARAANALRPNAEFHLKTPAAMRRLFAEYPDAIEASLAIAERCRFRLERQT